MIAQLRDGTCSRAKHIPLLDNTRNLVDLFFGSNSGLYVQFLSRLASSRLLSLNPWTPLETIRKSVLRIYNMIISNVTSKLSISVIVEQKLLNLHSEDKFCCSRFLGCIFARESPWM